MEASCSRSSSGVGFDLGPIQCQWTPYRARVGRVRQSAEIGQTIIISGPRGSALLPDGQPWAGLSSQVTRRKCQVGPLPAVTTSSAIPRQARPCLDHQRGQKQKSKRS